MGAYLGLGLTVGDYKCSKCKCSSYLDVKHIWAKADMRTHKERQGDRSCTHLAWGLTSSDDEDSRKSLSAYSAVTHMQTHTFTHTHIEMQGSTAEVDIPVRLSCISWL